jgi:DNA-binding NarL/FixJ family response regulator
MPNWQTALGSSAKLSKREKEVVLAVAEGLTNRQIAKQLGLTEHTVKNYLFRIYDKLGVSTRVELVIYGLSCHQRKPAPSPVPVKTGPQLAFVRSRESAV